ncbi:squalene synthase HpnC [Dactylosporangium sp. AC04546]|uniref:squalene synthase HpnC n=1 Tax=Dactylosporangium sp. AC04546 TaxID=2862460 RepID=UPI001EE058CB|nr:squalene synthase HpnC [Dactylosporangium sp. AC04546]WVK88827.1 squalene synthase HpnC [Dactylosporangium sp. AC04546]
MSDVTTDTAALTGGHVPLERARAENFPVALRILPRITRRHLFALYRYARFVDDLGDEPIAGVTAADRTAMLDAFEAEVHRLYDGQRVRHPVLCALAPTVEACRLPAGPLLRLIEANRVDQVVTRYATVEELVRYCSLSADPVGELVLHVFGQADPARVVLSDRVCTALQVVEHLQDIAEDHRRGRVYLPAADLDRFGVRDTDLAAATANSALRAVVRFEAGRAKAWLDAGAPLLTALHGWARVAVGGYLAGGYATLKALRRSGYDPLPGPPRPRRRDIAASWLAAMVRSTG